MLQKNRFALKEWAVVVKGLKTGRQLVLLRKGGIEDEGGEFRVEHSEFFLYPTFEHQHRKFLRSEFIPDFDGAIAEQPTSKDLVISCYAQVVDCVVAGSLEKLRRLAPYHLWNDAYIEMRFNYKPQLPLNVVVLRAFETLLVQVPDRAEYRGCKSWIELDRELSTAGARPALSDAEFEARRQAIRGLLGLAMSKPTSATCS